MLGVAVVAVMAVTLTPHSHPPAVSLTPASAADEAIPSTDPVYIDVQPEGRIMIGSQPVTLANLDAELSKVGVDPSDQWVNVQSGPGVSYREFRTVVSTLQRGGYLKINLVTENPT